VILQNENRPVLSATELCSPLNILFSDVYTTLILQSVPPLGSVKQGWLG